MCARFGRVFQVGVIVALSLLSSIALADPAEEFAKAQASLDVEEIMDGLVIMKRLAQQNYAPAQVVVAEFLDGAEEDEEAVGWYMMAASQGDLAGELGLGEMYLKGEGIKKDGEKALYWIKRAFEKDYFGAVKIMAHAYRVGSDLSGLPVAIDLELAKTLDEKVKVVETAKRLADLEKIKAKEEAQKKAAEAAKSKEAD